MLICGWNNNTEQILTTLEQDESFSRPVVLINQLNEEGIAELLTHFKKLDVRFVRGDFTRENILIRAAAQNAYAAVILPDTVAKITRVGDERTILTTLSLKTINPKIKVYAHIRDRENLSHLRKARADEVIVSDAHAGYLLANYIASPGVPQFVKQLFSGEFPVRLKRRMATNEKNDLLEVLENDAETGRIVYRNIACELVTRLQKSNRDIMKSTTAFTLALEG